LEYQLSLFIIFLLKNNREGWHSTFLECHPLGNFYPKSSGLEKYDFTSLVNIPLKKSRPIKLGIAIAPLRALVSNQTKRIFTIVEPY